MRYKKYILKIFYIRIVLTTRHLIVEFLMCDFIWLRAYAELLLPMVILYKCIMNKIKSFLPLLVCFCSIFASNAQNRVSKIEVKGRDIVLNFASDVSLLKSSPSSSEEYTIKRAKGRFGKYQTIGVTKGTSFPDENISGNPYDYYYQVSDSKGTLLALLSLDIELFGPNFYLYSPEDNKSAIGREINDIHTQMFHSEFSSNRYAFFFKPGDYTATGTLSIAYYTHLGGLGKLPYDVKLSNVYTPAPLSGNNATCTFWRSAENFTVAGASSSDVGTWFQWAVSQAAPLRRIYSERRAHYQWWWDGWCSGGFTGDCYFNDRAGSWSQQQWYFRNSYVAKGSQDYSAGGWNLAYQGMEFGSGVNMANHSDNWATSGGAWNNVSRVETTPIIREKPFLYIGDDGKYKVFRPGLRYDSKGVSWSRTNMGEGIEYDLENDFYVVKPGTSAQAMNAQLENGKHLFITPGIYELSEPLLVNNPNTIILGTGYATLIPGPTNPSAAIIIGDVDGVTIASLLFDAQYNSRTLMQVGSENARINHSANPTLLADLFFRVGGTRNENVNVDVALEINSSDVIGDHFWIWRADHGSGVGWTKNTSKNGLIVNGHFVTIYGLFNEHFQEYQTLWNGEKGRLYFLQCETPYDPPSQAAYMSHNGTVKGYAAYKVADHVNYHEASMLGIYDVFINTGGSLVAIENSIEAPDKTGIKIHHACDVNISTLGGFNYVINGRVSSTFNKSTGSRYYIVDYVGVEPSSTWERPTETGIVAPLSSNISGFSDPITNCLNITGADKNAKIVVSDINGRKIHQQTGIAPINMMPYEKGIYLVTVSGASDATTLKMIKK